MELFVQQLINGLTIGAFYALVALGYTMVYGVLKMINFAHGDLFMWGAYLGWVSLNFALAAFLQNSVFAIAPVVLFVLFTVGVMGVIIERVAYRPLRSAGRLAPIISALGVAFILESIARNAFGASYKVYPPFPPFQGMVSAPGKDGGPHPGQCIFQELVNQYTAVFPNHLFSRSPRDFYMIDVDPRTPTDYGLVRPYNSYWADRP